MKVFDHDSAFTLCPSGIVCQLGVQSPPSEVSIHSGQKSCRQLHQISKCTATILVPKTGHVLRIQYMGARAPTRTVLLSHKPQLEKYAGSLEGQITTLTRVFFPTFLLQCQEVSFLPMRAVMAPEPLSLCPLFPHTLRYIGLVLVSISIHSVTAEKESKPA